MLQPKRTKFRKFQKGRFDGLCGNLQSLSYGSYGIKTKESGQVSAQLIETFRRTLTRTFQRKGKIWIRVFPDIAVTKKPLEVRMGKGKGSPEYWMTRVSAGQLLFEMDGISPELAKKAMRSVSQKSPFQLSFVKHN
jgi:large subunit ribosomal protein L16